MATATLELDYFRAVSLYRRRSYESCAELCNALLQAGHDGHVEQQQAEHTRFGSNLQRIGPRPRGAAGGAGGAGAADSGASIMMPTWLMEGVWQLKMRALTQRVFLDDLEVDEAGDEANEEVEFERIATAARPGSSIKTAFQPRPLTSQRAQQQARSRVVGVGIEVAHSSDGRLNSSRPGSAAVARPGTTLIRVTSAAAFQVGDATAKLYQASRLNPTIYAERETLVKALFQFLYYHESDVQKAYSLCQAVMEVQRQKPGSGATASNLLYQRIKQPGKALSLIGEVVDTRPFDVTYRLEQARIHQAMEQQEDALQLYRLVAKLQPINVESLASIAVGYFYDNNPEMALMYYRRILSLGAHSAELYCNIALCCLYGGQIDLVLPCFQRALAMATQPEQKADIWYNLSFVAVTSGDFNLAKRCLQLCLTSDGQNGAALNNLAVLAAQGGDIMGAKSYLNAAKDVMPEGSEVTTNLQFMDVHYKLCLYLYLYLVFAHFRFRREFRFLFGIEFALTGLISLWAKMRQHSGLFLYFFFFFITDMAATCS
ncbi:hypothetical protein M5D96_012302 [Drosophila gunungcola]|uniref:Tetratricopeptide repeat protein 8 n=1 Tax=Drosophila gunungcola TaxID=103775 RepID=A0A9Q0BKH3_9MUSC|nr:hypothetical protein M5D96_012302 [Drosophila gunungcola]